MEAESPTSSSSDLTRTAIDVAERIESYEDLEKAEKLFLAAIESDPQGSSGARGHLAWFYYQHNRFEEAARLYKQLIHELPNLFDAIYYGALSLIRSRQRSEARPHHFTGCLAWVPAT